MNQMVTPSDGEPQRFQNMTEDVSTPIRSRDVPAITPSTETALPTRTIPTTCIPFFTTINYAC